MNNDKHTPSETVHIAFITDSNYVTPTIIAIRSLKECRNPHIPYRIYVICVEISQEDKNRISHLQDTNFDIDTRHFDDDFFHHNEQNRLHVSSAALHKFELPNRFPDLDKLLYLDSDILVLQDLAEFYAIDLQEYYAGVIKDFQGTVIQNHHTKNGLNHYFNSGVMLLNLAKMREMDTPAKLISHKEHKRNQFMDQDAFNVIFNEQVLFLPPKYNLMQVYLSHPIEIIAQFFEQTVDAMNDHLRSPIILHLTGNKKPWIHADAPFSYLWKGYYYAETDFKNGSDEYPITKDINPHSFWSHVYSSNFSKKFAARLAHKLDVVIEKQKFAMKTMENKQMPLQFENTSTIPANQPGNDFPLLNEAERLLTSVLTTHPNQFLWNGLNCGASYLSASEYQTLRDFIVNHQVATILEFGAGYTTALFKSLAKKQIAIENQQGPWVDFALNHQCDVRIVEFTKELGFEHSKMHQIINEIQPVEKNSTLLFIDSPPGTKNRAVVIEQIIHLIPNADFYVIHDSVRDASNVYRLASALNLKIAHHEMSWRGMTFLCKPSLKNQSFEQNHKTEYKAIQFSAEIVEKKTQEKGLDLFINLRNTGQTVIPSQKTGGLLFSVHLRSSSGEVLLWDTPRYEMPVDLLPGDHISFWINIANPPAGLEYVECDFVKKGEFWVSRLSQKQVLLQVS